MIGPIIAQYQRQPSPAAASRPTEWRRATW